MALLRQLPMFLGLGEPMGGGFKMGLLSGGGQAVLGSIFSTIYIPGKIYVQENIYDQWGELQTIEAEFDCKLQVDALTEAMRQQSGAAETDQRILVLTTSTSAPISTDVEVEPLAGGYANIRYQVASVASDPCFSYWELRGRRAS